MWYGSSICLFPERKLTTFFRGTMVKRSTDQGNNEDRDDGDVDDDDDYHGCLLSREPATGELVFWAAPSFGDERMVTQPTPVPKQ